MAENFLCFLLLTSTAEPPGAGQGEGKEEEEEKEPFLQPGTAPRRGVKGAGLAGEGL